MRISPATEADPASFYRDKAIQYLDLFHERNRHCLVVIDGLDEAVGWQVDTGVLPPDAAPGLRIVASARLLAGDCGVQPTGCVGSAGAAVGARSQELGGASPWIADGNRRRHRERWGAQLAPLFAARVDVLAELLRLDGGRAAC